MNKFWAGWIVHASLTSLHQDLLGKEKYVQACNLLWMDASITVPLALIGLVIAVFLLRRSDG